MAKTADFTREKRGQGWRHCQKCDGYTKGSRSEKCAGCGTPFATAKKRTTKAQTATGIGDALTVLDKVRQFVGSHGGASKATEAITAMTELVDACGSTDELKQAIETLAKWDGKK